MKKRGFTLAEVLITLAIIGVVAAISIPSVISNTQQQEFKTGLRKAVSVLNSAITMNMAIDGESPYDNANLFGYLQKHMAVMESTTRLKFAIASGGTGSTGKKILMAIMCFIQQMACDLNLLITEQKSYMDLNCMKAASISVRVQQHIQVKAAGQAGRVTHMRCHLAAGAEVTDLVPMI